jgi:hypothetical protein
MAINTNKTKYIIFRNRGQIIGENTPGVVFNNNEIGTENNPDRIFPLARIWNSAETTSYKLLGVLFDEFLSFDDHIKAIKAKISKSLFCINRLKNFLPQTTLRTLYFSLIHPHLLYCLNMYSISTKTKLDELFLLQKKAVRVVCNESYNAHTGPLFTRLNILPFHDLILFERLKFMHRFSYNNQPISFAFMWQTNYQLNAQENGGRLLRNVNDYAIPPHRIDIFKRSPAVSFASIWNTCVANKQNNSERGFLEEVKTKPKNGTLIARN